MSEQHPETAEVRPTGDDAVDSVVASLSALEDRPVAEHVTVFEQAHESLRRALADAGERAPARG
jgi:hypothetical protein